MSAIIPGTKISGYGEAGNAIKSQFEHLIADFPDIAGIHQWGTLNIMLDYPLRIIDPDYTTAPIEWTPGVKEKFSFTKVGLQLAPFDQPVVDAWIYIAHGSPHRGNALHIELLTATITIENGDHVLIYLPPYRYSSSIVL